MYTSKYIKLVSRIALVFIAFAAVSAHAAVTSTTSQSPLLTAISALKDHITGVAPLAPEQIEQNKLAIDADSALIGDTATSIQMSLDLVETYDTVHGPLWINTGSFTRDNPDNDKNIDWAIFKVMQYIMDYVYTSENLAAHYGLLNGYKFASSAKFPGHVDPPANPNSTHTATINASYLDTAGWPRQGDDLPARKPTGTYLAPGTFATVTVPQELVGKGYQVRVGAHSWDFEAKNRSPIRRLDRCTVLYDINSTQVQIANPIGGGIYIEVPYLANAGVVNVDITGAVRSPYFSAKTFHKTTLQQWQDVERHRPVPWVDFQSDKFMMQIPRSWCYAMEDPVSIIADWDKAIDTFNDLMGFPRIHGKETIYEQVDILNRSSVFAPGYPTVNCSDGDPSADRSDGYVNSYLVTGPRNAPDWVFHEHGHAYFFPKPPGENESTVNLPHVAIMQQAFGYDLDYAFRGSRGFLGNPHRSLDNTAVTWMTSFGFSPREIPMHRSEKIYQLKGHAKFVDIAQLFGWQALNDLWKSLVDQYENTGVYPADGDRYLDSDVFIYKLSKIVGADVRPLFHFWGTHPVNPDTLDSGIQAANLKPSSEIYNRLLEYRALIPANNAEFRTFAFNWWGKEPSIDGAWTETEHARQWDDQMRREEDILDPQRDPALGEEYLESSAADIRDVIDRLIAQYFPDGSPDINLPHMISWSEHPIQMELDTEVNPAATFTWSADPTDPITFSDPDVLNTIVTITKPQGDPQVFTLTLTIDDGVLPPFDEKMTIEVYDTACQATRQGLHIDSRLDLVIDCIIDNDDLNELTSNWLQGEILDAPAKKIDSETETIPQDDTTYDPVVYQDNFDNDGLDNPLGIGGGITLHNIYNAPWVDNGVLDFTPDGTSGKCRSMIESTEGFILPDGFRLQVTYEYSVNSSGRLNLGLMESYGYGLHDYLSEVDSSCPAYGIGMNLLNDRGPIGLNFASNASMGSITHLSNEQTLSGGPQTLVLEVDKNSNWAYSIDGAEPTTGVIEGGFDLTRAYHFAAYAQSSSNAEIHSVILSHPLAPKVNAGSDWVTWSDAPVTLDDVAITNAVFGDITYAWTADPSDAVIFDSDTIQSPTVTINKAPGDPRQVTLRLAVKVDGQTLDTVDTTTITVYDTPCQASNAIGLNPTDFNDDCITNLEDVAILAEQWMQGYAITKAVKLATIPGDLNDDNIVNLEDFAILAEDWNNGKGLDDLTQIAENWLGSYTIPLGIPVVETPAT